MKEGIPVSNAKEAPPFMRGELVVLKDNLPSDVLAALADSVQEGEKYKIYFVQSHPDMGGDSVYLGPTEGIEERDIQMFEPILIKAPQYRGKVLPGIAAKYFRRIGNA